MERNREKRYFTKEVAADGNVTLGSLGQDYQELIASFPVGTTIAQTKHATGGDGNLSVSVSLDSAPSGATYAILFTGGQQSAITQPSDPSGWTNLIWQDDHGGGVYWFRAALYEGTGQSFSLTLPSGATSAGGWSAFIFEVS